MSRTTVRAAIQAFLAPTPGITNLYKDMPPEMTGDNWQTNSLPGTPGYIHMDHSEETRIALGGEHGGWKKVEYVVSVVLLYQYLIPPNQGVTNQDAWVNGIDALVDAVITRIRSDRAFGTNGTPIFEAGNQDMGIQVHHDLPHWELGGGKVRNWVRVEFKVTEMVPA